MVNFTMLLDNVNTVVGSAGSKVAETAASGSQAAASGGGMSPVMMIVVYCAVIFGALYFFSIRPQKKREQQLQDLRSQIQVGDTVLLNNGMFGKVADIGAECFVIEFGTNKSIRIPVIKQEVLAKREPNLTNKEEVKEEPQEEKKGFLGFGKSKNEDK